MSSCNQTNGVQMQKSSVSPYSLNHTSYLWCLQVILHKQHPSVFPSSQWERLRLTAPAKWQVYFWEPVTWQANENATCGKRLITDRKLVDLWLWKLSPLHLLLLQKLSGCLKWGNNWSNLITFLICKNISSSRHKRLESKKSRRILTFI